MEAETCKRELVIAVPPEVVQKESEKIAADFARRARIPGFRPGHVPRDLVMSRYRSAIREEVAQALLPRFFKDTVKEQNLPVVGDARFEGLEFEQDQALKAKAVFEVYPAIELGRYTDLEVVEEQPSVTEEDVDKAVENLRESAATYEVAEQPATEGDLLTVNYEGRDTKAPQNPLVKVKEDTVRLGAKGTLGPFSDNLKGAVAGDIRQFEVSYPADFPNESVAGKRVAIRVEVLAVKRKVLQPLDDELARTVSQEPTLEALRASLRKQILESKQKQAEAASKRKLLDMLMDQQKFPLPEALVQEQANLKIRQVAGQLVDQGVDPRKAQVDWKNIRHDMAPIAEREVRENLILRKIAEAEKIEVSEEEVDESIRQLSAGSDESPAALKTRLTRNGGLARLQSSRLSQKALDFIYNHAKIVRQLRLVE